jgi:hypothetical protein
VFAYLSLAYALNSLCLVSETGPNQAVLFRHEMELDQTRKQHELELARQKEHVEGESKREIAMLNKEVQSREMMIDAFKIQTDTATRKLEEAQRQFEKQTRSLEVKEESRCEFCDRKNIRDSILIFCSAIFCA